MTLFESNEITFETEVERDWHDAYLRLLADVNVKRLWLSPAVIAEVTQGRICPAPDFKPGVYWVPETFGTGIIHIWEDYDGDCYGSVENLPPKGFKGQAFYRFTSRWREEEEFDDESRVRWWSPVTMPKRHARTFVAVETLGDGTRWIRPLSPPRDYAGKLEPPPEVFHPLSLTHYQTGMTAYLKAVSINTWLVGVTGRARIDFVSVTPSQWFSGDPEVQLSLRLRESNFPGYWGHSWVKRVDSGGHSRTLALVDDPETVRLYLLELGRVVGDLVTLTSEKALESDAIYWSVQTPSNRMAIGTSIVYALKELRYFFHPHLTSDLNIHARP